MIDLLFLQSIAFIRVRVTFEALEPIVLPVYKGSAFRGCIGETLHSEVCIHRGLDCVKCDERYACPFSQLFNSFVVPEHPHQRKYTKSPHPYIIDPMPGNQTDFDTGENFGFDLALIGTASEHLPLLLRIFRRMGEAGIGKGRKQFRPVALQTLRPNMEYEPLPYFGQVESISLSKLPEMPGNNKITMNLENPLRIKFNGKLLLSSPPFDLLVSRLVLRLGLLAHFYCGAPWPLQEPDLSHETTGIQISNAQLQEADWRRYSGSQDTTMNFDGLIGQITYEGEGLNQWMPLIALGSWLHVGSTATFGLGKYSIIK